MASPAGIDFFSLIWDCFVKSSAALITAILLVGLLRRHSASLRHFILSLFLVGLVFLPLFSVMPSSWELRCLPSWLYARAQSQAMIETAVLERNILPDGLSLSKSNASADHNLNAGNMTLPPSDTGIPNPGRILGAGLILLWITGIFFLLSRLALGILGASRLTQEGENLNDSAWQRLLERFFSAMPIRREVGLKSHRKVVVPLTWGLWRPVVIMPASAATWDEEKRSSALFHELSHVKRADFLVTLLVRLSLALFWFNPLSWVAFKMLKSEQEKACDELALRAGIRPSAYAAGLLSIKRSTGLPGYFSAAVLGMSGRSQLNDRLLAILRQKLAFKEVKMKTKIMVSVIAFLAVVLIGLARPSGSSFSDNAIPVAREAMIDTVDNPGENPIIQEKQQAQESQEKKQAEKAEKPEEPKEKFKKAKTIQIGTEETSKGPIEITIIEGDSKKTILVDRPSILIESDGAQKKIVVLSGDKEVLVIEGDEVQLKVKGDKTRLLKHAEPLKLDTGLEIRSIAKDKAGESLTIVKGKPYVKIIKNVGLPRHLTIHVESKEGKTTTMVLEPHLEVEPHVAIEPNVAIEPHLEVEPHVAIEPKIVLEPGVAVKPHVHGPNIVFEAVRQKELQKIIANTQELLNKIEIAGLEEAKLEAQKETLRELKESLKELKEELEREKEGLKTIGLKLKKAEKGFSVVLAEPHVTVDSSVDVLEEGKDNIITIMDDKGAYTVVFAGKLREGQLEAYESSVDKVKKSLPQGYELESKYHEKTNSFVIKVKGHDTTEDGRELVKKLIKELKEELKK